MTEDDEPEYSEAIVFGHKFKDLTSNIADLITLERDGAIFSHFWDDESQLFKYYRIDLLPAEIFQYVESNIALQQFNTAMENGASFNEALGSIQNCAIRKRVVSYGNYGHTRLRDGTTEDIRGCAASFYPSGMESLICGGRKDRYQLIPDMSTTSRLALVISAIDSFPVARRYLADRKHNRPAFLLANEYDSQDLLYCMLRSFFVDASLEEWTRKQAGNAKRIDIVIPSADIVIEVKHVRDKSHAQKVGDELKIDFESYYLHPNCQDLIAFVHDPEGHIVDPETFMRDLSGFRKKGDHEFQVHVLIR